MANMTIIFALINTHSTNNILRFLPTLTLSFLFSRIQTSTKTLNCSLASCQHQWCPQTWQCLANSYKELAHYALNCLSLPVSNAVVERIFSHVTKVKTKLQNKISLEMLDSLLQIRTSLVLKNKCCKNFVPSSTMLSKFNSAVMYCDSNSSLPIEQDVPEECSPDVIQCFQLLR
jgi:hypothetical protein